MKRVLAFDIDQTLNVAKTPITDEIADLLVRCLDHFEVSLGILRRSMLRVIGSAFHIEVRIKNLASSIFLSAFSSSSLFSYSPLSSLLSTIITIIK